MVMRIPVVLCVVMLTSFALAVPAHAHVRAAEASNLTSEITADPGIDGVTWRVHAAGELVSVRNEGRSTITVLGYEGEPYLRIGPGGVEQNRRSPATYVNSERYADVAIPPQADPDAAPEWRQVSETPAYVWHDHRTHWMSPDRPPAVRSEPRGEHHILDWSVPLLVDGVAAELGGELRWVPLPTRNVWWAGLLAAALAAAVLGRRVRDPLRLTASVVGLVAVANIAHLVDEVIARPQHWLDVVGGFLHTGFFVALGIAAAVWVLRGQDGPRLALGIGAGGLLFHQGLLQLRLLGATSVDTVWPVPMLRLLVLASVGVSVLAAVAIARTRSVAGDGGPHDGTFGPPDRGRVTVGGH